MRPRLIAISGPSKGTTFDLVDQEISIGRERTNSISLNDRSVSRHHCLIRNAVGADSSAQFTIQDLESYNGTFVNRAPVNQQRLNDGDQVAVGDVVFLFLLREEATSSPVEVDEDDLITRSTVRLHREDAHYLQSQEALKELVPADRILRNLNALLRISRAIGSIRSSDDLQTELFKLILEVIPAQRLVILFADRDAQEFSSSRGWNRFLGPNESIKGSRTIAGLVLREGVAQLSNDLTVQVGDVPSLVLAQVCSVLCVPLAVFDQPFGVIYLDTSDEAARFDEDHLQLLTAIAAIAAAAFERVREFEMAENETQRLKQELAIEHQMIGQSSSMNAVIRFIAKAAPSDSTVLIRGESGTGKELAAHAIHHNSERAARPFLAINGATLSETLLESELFGHEKGAFTGAINHKRGKLELAEGGTLFLDEVGEMTPTIQAKLLRVLQEREFERVGGTRRIKVDVRLVAATNKNLEDAVAAGTFREDLYYRLNVVSITMPPLRDRADDVQLLASYFCAEFSRKCKRRINGISAEARALLAAYDWPGNVRELQNVIERALVLGSSEFISSEDLPESIAEMSVREINRPNTYHELVKRAKSELIIAAVRKANGNFTDAARSLGLHPTNLHRLIRNLDLRSELMK